ncbi:MULTISPECIES: cation:proton antiporter [Leuconostoc]|uniref:cation:proton antiporter n=1 Tax=Leuconostoc TaxID=1243 RepID=UPI000D51FAE6|nr:MULTISPECIES: sodium:proton antiporter [Leuconostoc]KAA8325614.1 sodium:proton antiporter [Leuconostoc carnosum]KAA8374457.1 sodium:proton antiporter [Leuconostoc carnosum]KAA8376446.1 sodium:proton antiporter [Leuconostoc carnosum]KAA8378209.1 sodium:proton antiporter [Leuconostoc carnosum]KAA8381836.1 sodium:proton antiporter [Leuconostoc carnosum]
MTILYTLALLLIGIIGTNIIQPFLPKIPETFILIIVGICLSFTPTFKNFELEPEFFMLMVIAPLMFLDGQRQSFKKIRERFKVIFLLSVVLAIGSAAAVGIIANRIEVAWTFPLAITLAAIVVPTDAVAVKSLTSGTSMPKGVNEALELESLFNDATGLVMLDLALSVLEKGSFSIFSGLQHFLFVAIGGVIIGIISGFALVWLRTTLNFRASDPETTILPIGLLTPFAVYLLAEFFNTSGILAVVATGIVHNWESSKLRLTSTRVQLTQSAVWHTISNILNSIVFLILGISLRSVWHEVTNIGIRLSLQLVVLALLIYLTMFIVRFLWAKNADDRDTTAFFGDRSDKHHTLNARLFAISGVHGTVTLAMAFSLPTQIGGQNFPYREELIIVATLVILISMLISAVLLPILLPSKAQSFTDNELNHTRDQMVDYAILQIHQNINDHDVREKLTEQLQSQKGFIRINDRQEMLKNYQDLLSQTKTFVLTYLNSDQVNNHYTRPVIDTYQKIINRLYPAAHPHNPKAMLQSAKQRFQNQYKHTKLYHQNKKLVKTQKMLLQENWLSQNENQRQDWLNTRDELLELNYDVIEAVDAYLDDTLSQRLDDQYTDNQYIDYVRHEINHYFSIIKRDYKKDKPDIDNGFYMQAFQSEYNFVQQALMDNRISDTMANILYSEINQAQTLQLQQIRQLQSLN